MTLVQLRYLLAIVDAGLKITLAAKRVNATQPGLSKQIRQLEEQLRLKLFVRRGRNLERLTQAGQTIVERARGIIAEADNIIALAANERSEGGSLYIETTHIQAQFVLPQVMAMFRRQFPAVDISLGFAADDDMGSQGNSDADFAMFSTADGIPAGDTTIPLYRWHHVAVLPKGHALVANRQPISLSELARYPLLTYDTSRRAALSIAQTFADVGLTPRFSYAVRDATVIKAGVRDGLGVGLLAEMALNPHDDADFDYISLEGILPRCTAWAYLRNDRILRNYAAELLSRLSGLTTARVQRIASGDLVNVYGAEPPSWTEFREATAGLCQTNPVRSTVPSGGGV